MKTIFHLSFFILSLSAFACNSASADKSEPENGNKIEQVERPADSIKPEGMKSAKVEEVEEQAPTIETEKLIEKPSTKKVTPPAPPKPVYEQQEEAEIIEEVPIEFEEIPYNMLPEVVRMNEMNALFDGVLKKYVDAQGFVNYAGLKKNPADLNKYLDMLSATKTSGFSRNEGLAFWSNAYNAFTLKLMIDNYPLKSITDLKFGGKTAWDYVWITIDGKKLSLNQIENEILRPKYKEPRIHFIINCASFSCPVLLNKALTADNVQALMTQQAKRFINDPKRNKISSNSAQVSKLFDWYGADFGDLRVFLNKYSDTKIQEGTKIGFMEYDWSLNKQ